MLYTGAQTIGLIIIPNFVKLRCSNICFFLCDDRSIFYRFSDTHRGNIDAVLSHNESGVLIKHWNAKSPTVVIRNLVEKVLEALLADDPGCSALGLMEPTY